MFKQSWKLKFKKQFLTGLVLTFCFVATVNCSSTTSIPSVEEVDVGVGVVLTELSALEDLEVRVRFALLLLILLRDAFTAACVFVVGAVARRFAVNAALCSLED